MENRSYIAAVVGFISASVGKKILVQISVEIRSAAELASCALTCFQVCVLQSGNECLLKLCVAVSWSFSEVSAGTPWYLRKASQYEWRNCSAVQIFIFLLLGTPILLTCGLACFIKKIIGAYHFSLPSPSLPKTNGSKIKWRMAELRVFLLMPIKKSKSVLGWLISRVHTGAGTLFLFNSRQKSGKLFGYLFQLVGTDPVQSFATD